MEKRKKSNLAPLIFVFALSSLYFLAYCRYDIDFWDEGVPLSGVLRIAHGEKPGADFMSYAPLRYYLYFLSVKISGHAMLGPRILMAFLSGIIASLVYSVSRRWMPSKLALIPVFFFLVAPAPYYYRFLTLTVMILLWCCLRITDSPSRKNIILAGFLLGLCGWLREETGLMITFVAGVVSIAAILNLGFGKPGKFVKKGFPILGLDIGIGTAWLLKLFYFGGIQGLYSYYEKVWDNFRYGTAGLHVTWPIFWRQEFWNDSGAMIFHNGIIWLVAILLGLMGIYAVMFFRRDINWWILWGVSVYVFQLVVWRPGFVNLQRCLPPILIAVTVFFSRQKVAGQVPVKIGRSLFIFLGMCVVFDSLLVHPEDYRSIGLMRVSDYKIEVLDDEIIADRYVGSQIVQVTKVLKQSLKGARGLVCWPFHPLWNYLTGNPNPLYYDWLLPGMLSKTERERLCVELQRLRPSVVLIDDYPFDGISQRRFSRQYPELFSAVRRRYYRWMLVEDFEIYRLLPENKIDLLQSGYVSQHAFRSEGMNHIVDVPAGCHSWRALRQWGDARLDMEIILPEDAAIKFAVEISEDEYNTRYPDVEIRVLSNGEEQVIFNENMFPAFFDDGEVLLDVSNWEHNSVVLSFLSLGNEHVTWLNPCVFSFHQPDIDFITELSYPESRR